MQLKLYYLYTFFWVAIVCSCTKEQPPCTGNCLTVKIAGRAYVKSTGTALAGMPVEVNWFKFGGCVGCLPYKMPTGKTAADGSFSFTATIDSSFFKDYFLSVRMPADSNYLFNPIGGIHYNERRFYTADTTGMKQIDFEFYPAASLTIRLHRVQGDTFNYFSVTHNFTSSFNYEDCMLASSAIPTDTILTVPTAANMATTIAWKKGVNSGHSIEQSDSIICTKNGNNVYSIDY